MAASTGTLPASFASADLVYTDSYYSVGDVANSPDEKVPAFTIVNAALGYEAETWSSTLYAKNIFDEQYLTGIYADNVGSGGDAWRRPR